MNGAPTPVIILPSLDPDDALTGLVSALAAFHIIVVDDGSSPAHAKLFDTLEILENCTVCRHGQNKGKGAALKTAMRYVLVHYPDCPGIVTADADGQHSPKDIIRVAHALAETGKPILGVRSFTGDDVPLRSRLGNRVTSGIFQLVAGIPCPDTQTGLRGIPFWLLPKCLEIQGNRYEYEMNQLLTLAHLHIPVQYISISTIYLNGNRASHFHACRDSLRIYAGILKFGLSSGLSALIDLSLFTLAVNMVPVFPATVLARFLSGSVNFWLNQNWVFHSRGNAALWKYLLLFCCQMVSSGLLVTAFTALFSYALSVKIVVDTCLFFISYKIQKCWIFAPQKRSVNV